MNSTLNSLSLNVLLRNFFSGVFFIGAIYKGGMLDLGEFELAETLAGGALLALVAGTIVYAIHRTLINPWIEIFRYGSAGEKIQESEFFKKWFLSEVAIDILIDRWDSILRQEIDKISAFEFNLTPARYRGLSAWADYIHLFYCSSLSIVLGSLISLMLSDSQLVIDYGLTALAAILFALGLLSDIRRQFVEDRSIPKPERCKKQRG